MEISYSEKRIIESFDADINGNWRLPSVFNFMQNVAQYDAKNLGVGRSDMDARGIFWIISRIKVDILKYPKAFDEIVISTWHENAGGRLFYRYFGFDSPGGERLGEAQSMWVVMDANTRRIIKLPDDMSYKSSENTQPPILKPIRYTGEMETAETRTVRYGDLDINRHVNNSRYVEWVMDVLSPEMFNSHRIRDFQINYMDEARLGDSVRLDISDDGNTFFVNGYKGANPVFEAAGRWETAR